MECADRLASRQPDNDLRERSARAVRFGTASVVAGVAVVAAFVSYRHCFELVRANGEDFATAAVVPLTVDGLILAASMTVLDAAWRGHRPPVLARAALGLGISASIAANVAHGLGHGLVGALVAGWPALALILVFELLVRGIARPAGSAVSYGVPEPVVSVPAVPGRQGTDTAEFPGGPGGVPVPPDPLFARAAEVFKGDLAAGRQPSIRTVRAALSIGQPKAQQVRAYLAVLAEQNEDPGRPADLAQRL